MTVHEHKSKDTDLRKLEEVKNNNTGISVRDRLELSLRNYAFTTKLLLLLYSAGSFEIEIFKSDLFKSSVL